MIRYGASFVSRLPVLLDGDFLVKREALLVKRDGRDQRCYRSLLL
jgi:hypothetical protein